MDVLWHPTTASDQTRHDDIWFLTPEIGWAINSAGQIIHTVDGGKVWTTQQLASATTWLRCMSFSGPKEGWVGSITRNERLWRTQDGVNWTNIAASLPAVPSAICGIFSPSRDVVFGAGTQFPDRAAGVVRTVDGGRTWSQIVLTSQANLLIDVYFKDNMHGWVVGGRGGTRRDQLKPVVLHTTDGGNTWTDQLINSGISFPTGEWGWKIQFRNDQLGFVSLENFSAAAILKTTDGGATWTRIEVRDPQKNVNLEGIGFLDENTGWVGGWGAGIIPNSTGASSGTRDGGVTWFDANDVGRFINRFRFFPGGGPVIGYASGKTIYQGVPSPPPALRSRLLAEARAFADSADRELAVVTATDTLEMQFDVPQGAKQLTVAIFNPRQALVKTIEESNPAPGPRSLTWDFRNEDGSDAGLGHFIYRVVIDDKAFSRMVHRPWRAPPQELAKRVRDMIRSYASLAVRSHDDLTLPDATGNPVSLKSLFASPEQLMAAMIRGGWIVPGLPDRSMFLESIIGTGSNRGPMSEILAQSDIDLLNEWILSGAQIPGRP